MTRDPSTAVTPALPVSTIAPPAQQDPLHAAAEGPLPSARFPRGGLLILAAAGFTAVTTELLLLLLLLGHFTLFTYIAPFLLASGLPDTFTGVTLSVVGVSSLVGIWVAGLTADSRPRRSVLCAVALLVGAFALLPLLGGTWAGELVLVALWGTAFGAIGIYNQAAILRAGGEHRDAANGLTVVTIQLGIAVGAGYALTTVGAQFVPLAAAVPTAAALAIILASRRGGYPAGPRERTAPASRTRAARG